MQRLKNELLILSRHSGDAGTTEDRRLNIDSFLSAVQRYLTEDLLLTMPGHQLRAADQQAAVHFELGRFQKGGLSSLPVSQRLDHLQAERKKLEEQWDVTERTPEELESLDAQLAEIDDQIEPLMRLGTMNARLERLIEQREQHGTMTGDTSEGDFEDICDNIATLECEIAELEEEINGA